jgi:hypothetical protein
MTIGADTSFCLLAVRHRQTIAWKRQWIAAALGLGTIFGCAELDSRAYDSLPEWQRFRRVLRASAVIINDTQYRAQLLTENNGKDIVKAVEQAGLSVKHQQALCLWLYSTNDKTYSVEQLERAASALRDSKRINQIPVSAAMTMIILVHSNFFILLLAGSLSCVVYSASSSTQPEHAKAHFVTQWLFFLAVMTYIHWNMKLPSRVFLSAALACLMATIAVATSPATRRFEFQSAPKFPNLLVLLTVLASGWIVVESIAHSRKFARERITVKAELTAELSPEKVTIITVPYPFDRLHPFDNLNWMRGLSYVYLDGHQRSPRQRETAVETSINFLLTPKSKALGVEPHLRRQFHQYKP